jgi:hypothetical protein
MGYLKTRAFGPKVNQRSHVCRGTLDVRPCNTVSAFDRRMKLLTARRDSINVMSSDTTRRKRASFSLSMESLLSLLIGDRPNI